MAFCSNCGAKLDDNVKFCANCGAPVENLAANAMQAAETAAAGVGAAAAGAVAAAAETVAEPVQAAADEVQAAAAPVFQQPPQPAPQQPPQPAPQQPVYQQPYQQQPPQQQAQWQVQQAQYQQQQAAPQQPQWQQPQGAPQPQQAQQGASVQEKLEKVMNTADTTSAYDPKDISDNKVFAILAYFGLLVLVPLFAAKESPFAKFHTNQGLILLIAEVALAIIGYIPILGTIINIIGGILIFIFAIMGIVNAAKGQAKELPLVGSIKILK